jgi:hypothetical protein
MYDPAVKKLVWIGAAQHAIEPSKNRRKTSKGSIRERKNC